MCDLIDLESSIGNFHWTSANQAITYTLSGNPTVYEPFPGAGGGLEDSLDMVVATAEFTFANTGEILSALIERGELNMATVKIGRIHIYSPNLGRMDVFEGKIGDSNRNRTTVQGEVRNLWNSLSVRFPPYTYQDRCAWRFGGPGCGFDTSSVTISGSVNVSSSNALTFLAAGSLLAGQPNGRSDFGRVTITGGVNSGAIRTVRVHTGDLLQLSHPLPINDLTDLTFDLFPGCKKRFIEDCASVYNNTENFLGFPWIPIQEDAF
jgi:uncharacterized phage protein (TIGR02218 family)